MVYLSLALPSPVESMVFEGIPFYLKRDDLIHPDFSGNKARKFHYFLKHDLPKILRVVSYGSSQSNAMYSLSVLAKMKGWEFDYYVDHISTYLQENSQGNYRRALDYGMCIRELGENPEKHLGELKKRYGDDTLFIEEGGRQTEAEYGINLLAEEIITWQREKGIEKLHLFLPSGTGTTALYLQKSFMLLTHYSPLSTKVYTTPCVGSTGYLKEQFSMLESDETFHPVILESKKKYHFGKLYRESYKIWLKLRQETGVEFDLLYDPKGWLVIQEHSEVMSAPVLYIHQGGVIGNESMLPRYQRKYKDLSIENIL